MQLFFEQDCIKAIIVQRQLHYKVCNRGYYRQISYGSKKPDSLIFPFYFVLDYHAFVWLFKQIADLEVDLDL